MATNKQKVAAKKNIKKAQVKWKSMTHRQHALAQPQGRARQKPGTTGKGKFFHIEVRPKRDFKIFRIQDVGKKGGLERVAGKRPSGSWDTVAWLVSKEDAKIRNHELIIKDIHAKTVLKNLQGPIIRVKGDIFRAKPKKNVPERLKPTPAMKKAQKVNIAKAQKAKLLHNKFVWKKSK
jgi:hypothetical protein